MHIACSLPVAPLSAAHPAAHTHTSCCQVEALAGGVRNATLAGYLVRARADADTIEARAGFTARRDAVIAAGPQVGASLGHAGREGDGGPSANCVGMNGGASRRVLLLEHAPGSHMPL